MKRNCRPAYAEAASSIAAGRRIVSPSPVHLPVFSGNNARPASVTDHDRASAGLLASSNDLESHETPREFARPSKSPSENGP